MPSTRLQAARQDKDAQKAVAQRYRICLNQVKELPLLDRGQVRKEKLTLRDLFRRAKFQTADVASAIPMADSTLRGIVSGRTELSLPLTLTERLLSTLRVEWPAFVEAYENTLVARSETQQLKEAAE